MRRTRPLLVFLLSLGIALQGYASVRVMDPSCVMQQPASEQAPAAEPQSMQGMHDMHDMEHHHAGHGETPPVHPAHGTGHDDSTGHDAHCTGHLGCQLLNSAPAPILALQVSRRLVRQAPQAPAPAFHSHTAFLLWRPPAPHSV